MWGRRRKRGGHHPGNQLSRQLSLGLLEDAMARAEQQQDEAEPEPVPYPQAGNQAPAVPPARPGLADEDVPVDTSADRDPETGGQHAVPQHHQELPAQRSDDSTRHGSFG
jgi:hypothetical protein